MVGRRGIARVGVGGRPSASRLGRLVFALAFIGAVSAACSPAFVQMMLAKHGLGHGAAGGRGVGGLLFRGERDPEQRIDELRAQLVEQELFGIARYERISGRCGTPRFESDFRIDVGDGDEGPIRFVQSSGGDARNVSILRSKRLGMFSDQSRRFDEVYFLGRANEGIKQGIVMNAQNRAILGLRDVDTTAAALDRRFVRDQVSAAVEEGTRPRGLQTILGAPNNACTMLVTLTPDPDSRPFGSPDRHGRLFDHLFDPWGIGGVDDPTDTGPGPGDGTGVIDDTWRVDEVVEPRTPALDYVTGQGLDPFFRRHVDITDSVIGDTGLLGSVHGFGIDRQDDVAACDTGEPVTGRAAGDIVASAGLKAPDGSTTTVVQLGADPLAATRIDWSWAVSVTNLMPNGRQRQWIAEVHDGATRQGRVMQDGTIADGSEDQVRITDSAVIVNDPNQNTPMASLIQAFNSPQEGSDRSCDGSLLVPFPSTFPPVDAPTASASFTCAPSDTAVCLNNDRFQAEVFQDDVFAAASVSLFDPTASIHTFADDPSQQALIRVVNGCALNDHHWVSYTDTGSAPHSARVVDVQTGEQWSHQRFNGSGPISEWHLQAIPCM